MWSLVSFILQPVGIVGALTLEFSLVYDFSEHVLNLGSYSLISSGAYTL